MSVLVAVFVTALAAIEASQWSPVAHGGNAHFSWENPMANPGDFPTHCLRPGKVDGISDFPGWNDIAVLNPLSFLVIPHCMVGFDDITYPSNCKASDSSWMDLSVPKNSITEGQYGLLVVAMTPPSCVGPGFNTRV